MKRSKASSAFRPSPFSARIHDLRKPSGLLVGEARLHVFERDAARLPGIGHELFGFALREQRRKIAAHRDKGGGISGDLVAGGLRALADGGAEALLVLAIGGDGGEIGRGFEGRQQLVALFHIRRLHHEIPAFERGFRYGGERRLRLQGAGGQPNDLGAAEQRAGRKLDRDACRDRRPDRHREAG